ncbi:MAG: hypothetical protein R3B84_02180 [Zavarzinella sp.]
MRRTTGMAFVLALGWVTAGASDARAGWHQAFQTSCCGGESSTSTYFAPTPPPTRCAKIEYVQRCYYQPVTTYKMETYQEPVTSYRRSFYWEPVTSYRYSSYYDPCTGCCQRVAKPVTSYRLRSQCNAVQSYVQRCRMVPVTEMRKSYYVEPVVTYSDPCNNCNPCDTPSAGPTPGVREENTNPGTGGNQSAEPPRIDPQGIRYRKPLPAAPKVERLASLKQAGKLEGTVVFDDRITPRAKTVLRFVNAERPTEVVVTNTDHAGTFDVELPPGQWQLYLPTENGKPAYHSKLAVQAGDERLVKLVSR